MMNSYLLISLGQYNKSDFSSGYFGVTRLEDIGYNVNHGTTVYLNSNGIQKSYNSEMLADKVVPSYWMAL